MVFLCLLLFKIFKEPRAPNLCTITENEYFDSNSGIDLISCYGDGPLILLSNVTFQGILHQRQESLFLIYWDIFRIQNTRFFNCVFYQIFAMCITKNSLDVVNTTFRNCYDYAETPWAGLFQNHCPSIYFTNVAFDFNDTEHGTRTSLSVGYKESIFTNVSITHSEDYTGTAIGFQNNLNESIVIFNNCTIKESYTDVSFLIDSTANTIQTITITNCIFDDGGSGSHFAVAVATYSPELFVFENNTIANYHLQDTLIGQFAFKTQIKEFKLENITFVNNTGSPLFHGAAEILFFGVSHLIYSNCIFNNNHLNQDKTSNRLDGDYVYLNGDGGALQIGFDSDTSLMNFTFVDCSFIHNSCERNGGALALQTVSYIGIQRCSFISNQAGIIQETSNQKQIMNNYYHLKNGGRGGAIYINPYFNATTKNQQFPINEYMKQIKIEDCAFISNSADDGYAIYIEGDNKGTVFEIKNNVFQSNLANDPLKSSGAVIISEIDSLLPDNLNANNDFQDEYNGALIKEFLLVNHSAHFSFETFAFYSIPATQLSVVVGQFHKFSNRIGSSTSNSKSELTFCGVKFFVYGSFNTKYGQLIINLDDENLAIINEGDVSHKYSIDVLLYESPELEYMNHTLQLICQNNQFIEVTRIAIQQCNSPQFIDVNELTGSENWTIQQNNVFHGHIYQTDNENHFLSFEVNCSQFWILGDEKDGNIVLQIDNSSTIVTFQSNQNYKSLYASDFLSLDSLHAIRINPKDGLISIHGIMYTLDKPYYPIDLNFVGEWSNAHQKGRVTKSGSIESKYQGTEFKIYGAILPNGCSIKILFDEVEIATKSISSSTNFNAPNTLLFDSINEYKQPIDFGLHRIRIEIANKNSTHDSIEINGIYCQEFQIINETETIVRDGGGTSTKDKTAIIITGVVAGIIFLGSIIALICACVCAQKPIIAAPIVADGEEEEINDPWIGIDLESESIETP